MLDSFCSWKMTSSMFILTFSGSPSPPPKKFPPPIIAAPAPLRVFYPSPLFLVPPGYIYDCIMLSWNSWLLSPWALSSTSFYASIYDAVKAAYYSAAVAAAASYDWLMFYQRKIKDEIINKYCNLPYSIVYYPFQFGEYQTLVYHIVSMPFLFSKSLYRCKIHRNHLILPLLNFDRCGLEYYSLTYFVLCVNHFDQLLIFY